MDLVDPTGLCPQSPTTRSRGTLGGQSFAPVAQLPKTEALKNSESMLTRELRKAGTPQNDLWQREFGGDWDVQVNQVADLLLGVAAMAFDMPLGALGELRALNTAARAAKGLETGLSAATMARELSGAARAVGTEARTAFIATSDGIVRNVAAVDAPLIATPSRMTVTRFAANPLKTGIKALGQSGGSFATTAQEANQLGGLRIGNFRMIFNPKHAVNRLGLPPGSRPRFGMPLFGRDIDVPAGTPLRPGVVQQEFDLSGGAPEFFFPRPTSP